MTEYIQRLSELLTRSEAAELLGVSPTTLHRWEQAGRGPERIVMGRTVRYAEADLVEFVESCRVAG